MNVTTAKFVHLIGIGGVNMSAVAKLLLHTDIHVTGSDAVENEFTRELQEKGAEVFIGHDGTHISDSVELVIYSSAIPEDHVERLTAAKKQIPQMTNFAFLGEWTKQKGVLLVTGTHGKSTTTAMLGLSLIEAGFDPTVIVGSRVKEFPDRNLRLGSSDLYVIEGDEYAKHFLEFTATGIIINNIELDHTDVFKDLADMVETFRVLLHKVRSSGVVVANQDDVVVRRLIEEEREALQVKGIKIHYFSAESEPSIRPAVPGAMNIMNAKAAYTLATLMGADEKIVVSTLEEFHGIWRRFEKIAEKNDIAVFSDYGHHPTAVIKTLEAAKSFFHDRRIVLCFQPHHRNRTRHLFLDFVPAFDLADVLILTEIYDVKGREAADDATISSHDLVDAVVRHDADRGVSRSVVYATDPRHALEQLRACIQPGDIVLVMGAGDIYMIADQILL